MAVRNNTSQVRTPSGSAKAKSSGSIWSMKFGSKKQAMKPVEVLFFTSELADLLEAGMTLGQALSSLSNQGDEDSAQRAICKDLTERIVNGEAFSKALARHPKSFPPLYSNMIRAGEASGAMIDVLRRLVDHYERTDSMNGKIKSAMTYPMVVLFVGVLAVIFALTYIIPQFQRVFDSMGVALPLPTRIMMGMSHFVLAYGWYVVGGIVALYLWFKKWKSTPSGRLKVDGWKLKMPLIKGMVACGAFSSLAFTMKTLLVNGVNVLNALTICEQTCGNAVIGAALREAKQRVTDGTSISGPLAASKVFPKLMTDMLAVGEQAGNLPEALGHIGTRYQKDMDRNITNFTNALEPLLIVMIAGIVGFVAISVLMAVFKVTSAIG